MTTETTPLQERIAESFCEPAHRSRWPLVLVTTFCGQCWERSTAALPFIAAEVRKAQADAWDEGWTAELDANNPYEQEN